ncbi:hypothetical protein GOODEAATRI_005578, partial [Goodea atripinnis]
IMGKAHGVPVATLTSVSLVGVVRQPWSQPSALLGFWPLWFVFPEPVAMVCLTDAVQ